MRIRSLDLARGFTVLMIAPIHTMMLYSEPFVHQTLLGKLFEFIAEGPGAQLFMTLMGITFRKNKKVFKRAFLLLIVAYVLNIFKFIIPISLGILPHSFILLLPVKMFDILLIGDILQFAAIALMILFLVKYLNNNPIVPLIIAAVIMFISPLLWDKHDDNIFINHVLLLTGGQPPQTYFPLFPWLVYPLTGLCIGYYIKLNPEKLFSDIKYIGFFSIITGHLFDSGKTISFYRTYPASTLTLIGIVLITLYAWNILDKNVRPNHFFDLLSFMSRHITAVYIIQWIVIMWTLPFFGFQKLNLFSSVIAILFTSCCTLFLTIAFNFYRDRK